MKADGLIADRKDFHSLSWMVFLDLELGRKDDAEAALALFSADMRAGLDGARGYYMNVVTEYLAVTEDWDRAEELIAPLEAMLPLMRKLVEHTDRLVDAEPGVMGASPHEGLARVLMDLGKAAEAQAEYEAVLVKHPNRARVLLAAARAATKAGNAAAARAHYETLAAVWKTADADFPGLDEVTAAVAAPAPADPTPAPAAPAVPPKPHHH